MNTLSAHQFDRYVSARRANVDVATAGLLAALDAHPDLDIDRYSDVIDDLAERVLDEAGGSDVPLPLQWAALRQVLVDDVGLEGDPDDSYDPASCHLHEVLDNKLGTPVSLSCIWIAVGQRAGYRVSGLTMPDHFAVCIAAPDGVLIVDAFCDGLLLDEPPMTGPSRLRQSFGAAPSGRLRRVSNLVTLGRLLSALKTAYLCRGNLSAAVQVCQRLTAVWPDSAKRHADLGLVAMRAERFGLASEALSTALSLCPPPATAGKIRNLLTVAGSAWAACN